MSFKEIFCQDKSITALQRAFATGKWPHAYIFAGPDGVGRFKTAVEWAKLLLCEQPIVENNNSISFADSCSSCESCRAIEVGSHPDFNHIYKELLEFTSAGKGRSPPVELPIDVIREFLIDKVHVRPSLSQRKVFVVSEAEKLNIASQNALLKVLEEPPGYCCIILLCTRLEKLLATTKSRCQILRFGPIEESQIIEKLGSMGLSQDKARYFAHFSQGSLGTAIQYARLELGAVPLYKIKKELVSSLATYKLADAVEFAQRFLNESRKIAEVWTGIEKTASKADINRRAQKTLIKIIISALYDVMTLNVAPAKPSFNFDQEQHIVKLAARFNPDQAATKIADCYKALRWVESGVNEKLIFEHLLLNLATSDIISSS
jgi:DNA polymerase-3 subunit delta'